MVVTLPIATIKRILDRVSSLPKPEPASDLFVAGIFIPMPTTKPGPTLPENIVSALERATHDKTLVDGRKHVGHLRRDDFIALRDWCRAMRLGSDAAAVEAAITAAPE